MPGARSQSKATLALRDYLPEPQTWLLRLVSKLKVLHSIWYGHSIWYCMDICNATGNSGAEWRQPSDIGSGSAGDVVQSCVGSTTMLSTKGTVETQHAKWLGWKRHRHSYRHFFPALLQGRSGAKAPKHKATTANQSRHEALRLPNERGARTTVPKRQRQQNLRRPVQREAWYRQQVWYR